MCIASPISSSGAAPVRMQQFFALPLMEQGMKNRSILRTPPATLFPLVWRYNYVRLSRLHPSHSSSLYGRCLSARKYSFVVFVLCTGIGSTVCKTRSTTTTGNASVCVCERECCTCVCVCAELGRVFFAQFECFADFMPCAL